MVNRIDRHLSVTLSMVGGPAALDLNVVIRKNAKWKDMNGLDAYELDLDGVRYLGPTPGYVLDKAMADMREMQDDAFASLIEGEERKAGWDPNP